MKFDAGLLQKCRELLVWGRRWQRSGWFVGYGSKSDNVLQSRETWLLLVGVWEREEQLLEMSRPCVQESGGGRLGGMVARLDCLLMTMRGEFCVLPRTPRVAWVELAKTRLELAEATWWAACDVALEILLSEGKGEQSDDEVSV